MRRFALRNSRGEYFDLMREDAFFHDPEGLGFNKSNSYIRVGSSFILVKEESDQSAVSGNIYFANQDSYAEFARFISFEPLILLYSPVDTKYVGSIPETIANDADRANWWDNVYKTWYRLDGRFTEVSKADTEHTYLGDSGVESNVTFSAETKWYLPRIYNSVRYDFAQYKYYDPNNASGPVQQPEINLDWTGYRYYSPKEDPDGYYYAARYGRLPNFDEWGVYPDPDGYFYNYIYEDGVGANVYIFNEGTEESPTDIRIYGPVESPSWQLLYGREVICSGQLSKSIPEGYYLRINSRTNHLEIQLYRVLNDELVENYYQYVDFDKENFVKVPRTMTPDAFVFNIWSKGSETLENINVVLEVDEVHETV